MKTLILGAGVVGTVYAWQMSQAGYDVTLWVRQGKREQVEKEGVHIRCTDSRGKKNEQLDTVYRPKVVDDVSPEDGYQLIIVCVKSNQVEPVLPMLAERLGKADVLFFQNNWWGDEKIKQHLPPSRCLFGFSRVVGGWKTDNGIECMLFNSPGMATMLGEKDGQNSSRLEKIEEMMKKSGMKPEISPNILGWLATHYVEYLGATGAILKAGSAKDFAKNSSLVKEAILATREGLDVCRARGIDVGKSAPQNLKLYGLPLFVLVPIGQWQYGMANIQLFFDEVTAHNMDEASAQYYDVLNEGGRLGIKMPFLRGFEKFYQEYRKGL